MATHEQTGVGDVNTRLLRALAEELRLPLVQIARQAELSQNSKDLKSNLKNIEATAEATLGLLDSYLLTTRLLLEQQTLDLSPVPVSATLYDSAQDVYKLAKLYEAEIDIEVHGKCGQAMAHPTGLRAALSSLAYNFIYAPTQKKTKVAFFASRHHGIVHTGVISNNQFNKHDLDEARQLFGSARQPSAKLSGRGGAGVFVADKIFSAMSSSLKVGHVHKSAGLFGELTPNQQLALI